MTIRMIENAIESLRMQFKEKDPVWDLQLGVITVYILFMNEISKERLGREASDPNPESQQRDWDSHYERKKPKMYVILEAKGIKSITIEMNN